MAAAIGKGDWVRCVDARNEIGGPLFDGGFLKDGHVYCVEETSTATLNGQTGMPSLRLVGQPDKHGTTGRRGSYGVWRFKPLGGNAKTLTAPPITAPVRESEVV